MRPTHQLQVSHPVNCILTHHASARMQQRGIKRVDLNWAIGIETVYQKQGMDIVVIRDKDIPDWVPGETWKHIKGLVVYLSEGVVVTTYKAGKRAHRNLRKKVKVDGKKWQNWAV